jgi:hypothetical protein
MSVARWRVEEKKIVSALLDFVTETDYTEQSKDSGDTLIDSVTLQCMSVQKENDTTRNSSLTTRIRMTILSLNLAPQFTVIIFMPQLENVPTHTAHVSVTAPA